MAGDTDFLALYQELGLGADCSLHDIKRAYRKRVGALHPDRVPGDATAMRDLQQLNVLYASALEFERRHGRLPGATQVSAGAAPIAPVTPVAAVHETVQPAAPVASQSRTAFYGLLATLGLLALWAWLDTDHGPPLPSGVAGTTTSQVTTASVDSPSIEAIERGSPRNHVRALHGDPVNGSEQRWEYGPSWVAFRCGVVSDWYSSPLRPLKVAALPAASSDAWSPPKNCKE